MGASAPAAGSLSNLNGSQLSPASESTAVGLLELPETIEESRDAEAIHESTSQIISGPTISADANTDPARTAVVEALNTGGHATAATLIDDGKWTIEGSSVRIEVNAKATMIRLTFNAAAEKLIRQGLSQAGAPSRFMIVPGEGLTSSGASAKVRAPLGSIENEARSNPLVVQAQAVFNAEIVTVVDLREK
jgi:DNA polymerase-3 subunit gamma/tau